MSQLEQKLAAGNSSLPPKSLRPRGRSAVRLWQRPGLCRGVTAVNVTDNQGANMRMTPLAMAACCIREGIEPILQVTCRDRNRLALQSDLLGAAALGIENLLVLSGRSRSRSAITPAPRRSSTSIRCNCCRPSGG